MAAAAAVASTAADVANAAIAEAARLVALDSKAAGASAAAEAAANAGAEAVSAAPPSRIPTPPPEPSARLGAKEWMVLKHAKAMGVLPDAEGGKTGLPSGWIKQFGKGGEVVFLHQESGVAVGSIGEVVAVAGGASASGAEGGGCVVVDTGAAPAPLQVPQQPVGAAEAVALIEQAAEAAASTELEKSQL